MADANEDTCGVCLAFMATPAAQDPERLGTCRLRPELGIIGESLPRCPKFVHRKTGARWNPPRVFKTPKSRSGGASESPRVVNKGYGETFDFGELGAESMDTNALKAILRDVFAEEGHMGDTPLGGRWEGGTLVLRPADTSLKAKEIPIEQFFYKIVMLRERLRVLEQKINNNAKLDSADKVELQQYITRVYGTLTTFNILFRDKDDYFVGAKGE